MGLFGSSSRKGTSVPFGEYFINEYTYQVNGLLFLFMGIITIIKDGYNHLTLRQTYDWSQRIWLIYGIILIALAIITHQVYILFLLYFTNNIYTNIYTLIFRVHVQQTLNMQYV